MNIRILKILIFTFHSGLSFAQFIDHNLINTPVGQTPNAASILKFVDIPANNYVGTPIISVPIFELKGQGITLPISLTYQSFGLKVDEIPSWIGSGWTLNATGAVGRTIMDLPDNYGEGYLSTTSKEYFNQDTTHVLLYGSPIIDSCQVTAANLHDYPIEYYKKLNPSFYGHGIDTEPDVFTFSTPLGVSGKFVFDQTGQIRLIPKTGVVVQPMFGSNINDLWFRIIDEKGIMADFSGGTELVHTTSVCDNFSGSIPMLTTTPVSTWFISKLMSLKTNEEVTYTYASEVTTVSKFESSKGFQIAAAEGATPHEANLNYTCNSTTTTYGSVPASINFGDYKIIFSTATRLDIGGGLRLKRISVLFNSDTIRQFDLYHSYLNLNGYLMLDSIVESGSDGTKIPSYKFNYMNRQANVSRGSNDQDHWGFYNDASNSTLLPTYQHPPLINYRGANKEPNLEAAKTGVMDRMYYPTGGYSEFQYEPHRYRVDDFEWLPVSQTVLANTSSPLIYGVYTHSVSFSVAEPTWVDVTAIFTCPSSGGEIQADCGIEITGPSLNNGNQSAILNECQNCFVKLDQAGTYTLTSKRPSINSPVDAVLGTISYKVRGNPITEKHGGGIRIKSITQFDVTGSVQSVKEYDYVLESGLSSGRLMSEPVYTYDITFSDCGDCPPSEGNPWCYEFEDITYRILKPVSLKQGFSQGSSVSYDRVVERHRSSFSGAPLGKTVFVYSNSADLFQLTNIYPYTPNISNSYQNGKLLNMSVYNSSDQKVKETITIIRPEVMGEVNWIWGFQATPLKNQTCPKCEFIFSTYSHVSRPIAEDSVVEINYAQGISSATFKKNIYEVVPETYYSDKYLLLRSTRVVDAMGSVRVTENKYPYDFKGTNLLMDSLHRKNIISPVWQIYKDGSGEVYDGLILSYKKVSVPGSFDQFHIDKVFGMELSSPIPYTSISSIQDLRNPNSYFKLRQTLKYDAKADLIQVQRNDDFPLAILWQSDHDSNPARIPIAHISMALSNQVFHTSFEDFSTNVTSVARTGIKGYTTSYQVNLPSPGNYKLSYWRKLTGAWELVEMIVNSNTIIGGGGYIIDEVRLSPPEAHMTTYTYEPKYGITSTTDVNQKTTFYIYDDLGRMIMLKDEQGNILKRLVYHYQKE